MKSTTSELSNNGNNAHPALLLRALLFVSAAAVLAAGAADAAEWRISPEVSVAGEVDDNADLNFITVSERDISGYVVQGRARFTYTSPVTEFFIEPLVRIRDYGEEDFDSEDGFLRFNFDRNFKSSRFRLISRFEDELARTAERADVGEIDIDNPEVIPEDDSGRVFATGRRQKFEVFPEWRYDLSEISSIGINVRYTDVSYDDVLSGLLNDFTDISTRLSFRRDWSERSTAIFEADYQTYEADCPTCGDAIGTYGVNIGFQNRLSPTTTLTATVGVDNTELTTGEDEVTPVANLLLRRRLETITLFAQYTRVISGGGGGSLLARDVINLNFERQLNDRFRAGLGVRAYATSALEEGTVTIDERDYVQLRALVEWNLTRTLSLEAIYRYTVNSREVIGESANSNNFVLAVHWRPGPFVQ